MLKYCPHCNEEIDHLDYECDYTETAYGREWGSYDLQHEDHNQDDSENQGYDDYATENYRYSCPECERRVDPDDLLDEPNDDEEEEDINDIEVTIRKKPSRNVINLIKVM